MDPIGLGPQTMFAELVQRALDAEFDANYDERGSFIRKRINGFLYWYYQRKIRGKVQRKYVGPVRDKAINERVKRFNELKASYKQRRTMVRALNTIGIEPPDPITGAVMEALWKEGFFRLRGVLVGTAAFQCYAGILGVKLTSASLMTADIDLAQFYDISHMVGDSLPPMLELLRTVDDTFEAIPDIIHPVRVTRYRARSNNYIVEFLTPNRGSDENTRNPSEMPALGGASARPLRYLDYLIHEPIRSVALYKGGIPVLVPSPERYGVHKLIVATLREENPAKSPKDVMQASQIIRACLQQRSFNLFEAWAEAWERGPSWRRQLKAGVELLDEDVRNDFIFSMQGHGWSGRGLKVSNPARKEKPVSKRKTPKKRVLKKGTTAIRKNK